MQILLIIHHVCLYADRASTVVPLRNRNVTGCKILKENYCFIYKNMKYDVIKFS